MEMLLFGAHTHTQTCPCPCVWSLDPASQCDHHHWHFTDFMAHNTRPFVRSFVACAVAQVHALHTWSMAAAAANYDCGGEWACHRWGCRTDDGVRPPRSQHGGHLSVRAPDNGHFAGLGRRHAADTVSEWTHAHTCIWLLCETHARARAREHTHTREHTRTHWCHTFVRVIATGWCTG